MNNMFSKIFGGGGDAKPAAVVNGDGGQKSAVANDTNMMTGDIKKQPPQDPLASFAKVFDNGSDSEKKAPQFKLSPEVLKQATDSLDFSQALPKDFKERMANNDETLWPEIMNSLGRQTYQHAMEHTSALTDRFVSLRSDHDRSGYGTEVSRHMAKQSLQSIAAKSPATAKFMEQLQAEVFSSNPDATPEFVEEQVRKGIMSMAGIIDPEAFVEGQKKVKLNSDGTVGDTDWDAWSRKKPAGS